MFNEDLYKDYSKKLELSLIRDNEGLLSSWQISNMIEQLSKYYYKNEIINTMSIALKEGVKPENIFIFHDSFKINNLYTDLDVLDLNDVNGAKEFYHFGQPIGLFPNEKLEKIKISFRFFRDINMLFNSKNLNWLDKDYLVEIIRLITLNRPMDLIFDKIEEYAFSTISINKNDDVNIQQLITSVKKIKKSTIKNFDKLEDDLIIINILKEYLQDNDISILRDDKYKQHESKYFNAFHVKFEKLLRPVVGIYYPNSNKVKILCTKLIDKKEQKSRNSRFLDIKNLSHNSPYILDLFIGITAVPSLISILTYIKNNNQLKKEEQKATTLANNSDKELSNVLNLLETINKKEEFKAIHEISNDYVKDSLIKSQNINNEKFKEPIKRYGFANNNINIKIVNLEEDKS